MSEPQTHISLQTQDLTIGYKSKKTQSVIASGINLSIAQGQLVGIIGINGSGKSTLIRSLSGLQEILSGTIQIAGKSITQYISQRLAQELSVVLTGQMISKNLSVGELVALGRHPYTNWLGRIDTRDQEIIDKALEDTDSYQLKEMKCYTLSDGQLQRVLIARALAQNTSLIILDEPLTHLDLHHKASLLTLLSKICKTQGKTILFSTHDIEHAIPLCDQMIVMKDETVLMDSPQQLAQNGVFNRLFPSDSVQFDINSGRFSIEK